MAYNDKDQGFGFIYFPEFNIRGTNEVCKPEPKVECLFSTDMDCENAKRAFPCKNCGRTDSED